MGQVLDNCTSTGWGPCAEFQKGLWMSANSVGNTNTAKSLQKSKNKFASRRKKSQPLEPGSFWGYTLYINYQWTLKNKIKNL